MDSAEINKRFSEFLETYEEDRKNEIWLAQPVVSQFLEMKE